MDIRQQFTVDHALPAVWNALADPALVAACLPGAELGQSTDGRHYSGKMRVKLGPISAAFSGEAVIDRDPASHSGSVEGKGSDARSGSRAQARMRYRVEPANGTGSAVTIEAEITLSGALAQFGRSSIVNDIAARLTQEFAKNLQARLATAPVAAMPEPGHGSSSPTPMAPPPLPAAAPLNPLRLLISVLADRVMRALARLFGRVGR